jgi:hypothetical protein
LWDSRQRTGDQAGQSRLSFIHANRLVRLKGPSQNGWFRNSERYHKNLTCASTKNVHQATEIEIERDDDRKSSYWLIVFPKDVVLDNHIFSKDADIVEPKWNSLTSTEQENVAEVKLYAIAMMWIIGEDGGRRTSTPSGTPVAKDLFK